MVQAQNSAQRHHFWTGLTSDVCPTIHDRGGGLLLSLCEFPRNLSLSLMNKFRMPRVSRSYTFLLQGSSYSRTQRVCGASRIGKCMSRLPRARRRLLSESCERMNDKTIGSSLKKKRFTITKISAKTHWHPQLEEASLRKSIYEATSTSTAARLGVLDEEWSQLDSPRAHLDLFSNFPPVE